MILKKNNEEALSEYMKKSESLVTAIDSNTVTFSNGLTISHNPETGEVNFSFN